MYIFVSSFLFGALARKRHRRKMLIRQNIGEQQQKELSHHAELDTISPFFSFCTFGYSLQSWDVNECDMADMDGAYNMVLNIEKDGYRGKNMFSITALRTLAVQHFNSQNNIGV